MHDHAEDGEYDIKSRILQNTLGEMAAQDKDAADCCVICLDVISEPCEAFPCGHNNFDYACLTSWVFEHPRCPLCKAKVKKVLHGPADARITTVVEQKPAGTSSSTQTPLHGYERVRSNLQRTSRQQIRNTAIIAFRRDVYRHQWSSKHVGSNQLSRYRELTPQLFRMDAELVSRARMWIRRELQAFSFLSPESNAGNASAAQPAANTFRTAIERRRAGNSEFLLEYIVAILKSVDIMGSGGHAENMLSDYLGRINTRIFLHELRAWLRSPFTRLEDWDGAVQYERKSVDRRYVSSSYGERMERMGVPSPPLAQMYVSRARQIGDFYRPRPASRPRRGMLGSGNGREVGGRSTPSRAGLSGKDGISICDT